MPSWLTLFAFEAQEGQTGEERAGKPHATPMLVLALAFWAGAAVAYRANQALVGGFAWGLTGLSLALALMAACALWRGLPATPCLLIIGLGLGSACGSVAGISMHVQQGLSSNEKAVERVFVVTEDIHYGEFSNSCIASTELSNGDTIKVRLILRSDDADLHCGDVIRAHATMRPPADISQDYYWNQGIPASATLYSFERLERHDPLALLFDLRRVGLSAFEGFEGQGVELLRAVVFGERAQLGDSGLYAAVKVTGLAHLVAVSGSHLSIVVAFIAMGMRPLRLPRPVAVVLQMGCVLSYVVCTGLAISAIRAACMAMVSMGAYFANRRSSSLSSLGVCIIGMVLIDPTTAVSVSFALSALSTLGIVVLGRLFDSWCRGFVLTRNKVVREGLSMTLASSVLAVPLSAAVFAQLSLISPAANILAGPVFAVLCAGGLAAALLAVVLPPIGTVAVTILVGISEGFCTGVEALAHVPFAAVPWNGDAAASIGFSVVLMLVLWRLWPSKKAMLRGAFGATVLCICLAAGGLFLASDEIVMLDVGQGDAFLLKSASASVLIDTGTADTQLLQGLARHGVYSLDAVVITHPDDDHCGSLLALEGIVSVKQVCFAAEVDRCDCASCTKLARAARTLVGEEGVVRLNKDDVMRVGRFEVEVLWPASFTDKGGNADSLVMLARFPKGAGDASWQALFCGDAEADQITAIMQEEDVRELDLLKVGHHGSKVALSEEIAGQLSPKAALISVGAQNRYGHPSHEVLELLDGVGCEVFRTDEEGDVVCKLDAEKLRIDALG